MLAGGGGGGTSDRAVCVFFPVCMYKEPSLHELEEKLQKESRSPTLNSREPGQNGEGGEGEQQEDCTEQDGS